MYISLCLFFQVRVAPQLLWTWTSGALEDAGEDTEGIEHRAARCRVDAVSVHGCGGEGSWHRDLMHKQIQKSHCQGFPLFHSSTDDGVMFPVLDAFFVFLTMYLFDCSYVVKNLILRWDEYDLLVSHNLENCKRTPKIVSWCMQLNVLLSEI